MATERDMLDLLLARYTSIRRGTTADRWVRAEHVRNQLGGDTRRIADFIAIDKYPGLPYGSTLALHGHEVKVSRADWLTELRDPSKAEAFRPYMHHWWLVVSDPTIVHPGELPTGWGLIVKRGSTLRAAVQAPRHEPKPLPLDLTICIAAAAARTAHREPLHRDAPRTSVDQRWNVCSWCGNDGPCLTHQPRAHAALAAIEGA